MARQPAGPNGFSLFTDIGERKYLSPHERTLFMDAAARLSDPAHYTFCAMLHWTGCRPSEARAISALHIDCDSGAITISSLKKRGVQRGCHFRSVPVPEEFITLLVIRARHQGAPVLHG